MDENIKKELQSATFERLLKHLNKRKDVQNIDIMNLAGFCRNCLSRWYKEEAEKKNIQISDLDAREHIYGMPYQEWKKKFQKWVYFNCNYIIFFKSSNSIIFIYSLW